MLEPFAPEDGLEHAVLDPLAPGSSLRHGLVGAKAGLNKFRLARIYSTMDEPPRLACRVPHGMS